MSLGGVAFAGGLLGDLHSCHDVLDQQCRNMQQDQPMYTCGHLIWLQLDHVFTLENFNNDFNFQSRNQMNLHIIHIHMSMKFRYPSYVDFEI